MRRGRILPRRPGLQIHLEVAQSIIWRNVGCEHLRHVETFDPQIALTMPFRAGQIAVEARRQLGLPGRGFQDCAQPQARVPAGQHHSHVVDRQRRRVGAAVDPDHPGVDQVQTIWQHQLAAFEQRADAFETHLTAGFADQRQLHAVDGDAQGVQHGAEQQALGREVERKPVRVQSLVGTA